MIRLGLNDRPRLVQFLRQDVSSNLYMLSMLYRAEQSPNDTGLGTFYAMASGGELSAVVYATYGGLVVTYSPEAALAQVMGAKLKNIVNARMLVGPRQATDAMWKGLDARFTPRIYRDHQLYTLVDSALAIKGDDAVRTATPRDLDRACASAADMQTEELGIDPRRVDPERFRRRVARLISEDVFYVLDADHVFGFQASAGTHCSGGTQIEAVYTPPHLRGKGWATRGLAGMCENLFTRFPLITLHVNEKNTAAIQLYERLGFEAKESFRLISC